MNAKYPKLFSPLKIGHHTIKNRISCSPQSVSGGMDINGLTQRGFDFYLEKARGGAGIVTVGETQLLSDFFQKPNASETTKYRLLTDMMKNYGTLPAIEIGHRGGESFDAYLPNGHVEGPCSGVSFPFGFVIDEITPERMLELCDCYVQACEVIVESGFDMVMLHGGHSWLIAQFLSPLFNHRTDEYGGSLENRARFPLMILQRIHEKFSNRLLVDFRMSAEEFLDGGFHIKEAQEFAKMIEPYVNIIHASVGTHLDPWCRTFNSIYHENGTNRGLSRAIKQVVSIPVVTIGGINTPELCEEILESGDADIICLGRQMFADPMFAAKAEAGKDEEINTCIRCMCCHSAPAPPTYANCTVNPNACKEFLNLTNPNLFGKKIMVIGGGPGGMVAACRAFDCGASVSLYEKSSHLGGSLSFADYDRYKGDLKKYRDNLVHRTEKRNIDLWLDTEVTPKLLADINPDIVICAIGAEKNIPPIPGIENAVYATDVYEISPTMLGDNILVIGGGLIGCELSMHLISTGKKVTILEMQKDLAPEGYRMHREWLLQRLTRDAVCLTESKCTAIRRNGVTYMDTDGNEHEVCADTVVFALGMKPKTDSVNCLREASNSVFITIGDCKCTGKVKDAVHDGYFCLNTLA